MYTLSLLFQILMYQAFSLVDFLALMELGDLHSTERKFFSNFLLIWYFLILEVKCLALLELVNLHKIVWD